MFDKSMIQVRELFLKHKAAELDRAMGIIKTQEEAGWHVRMLTNEIRSTLDRHTILNTTLVELAKTLSLENCTIWMPNSEGDALELTHELERRFIQVFFFMVSYFRSKLQDLRAYKFQSSKLSCIMSSCTSGHFLKLLYSL